MKLLALAVVYVLMFIPVGMHAVDPATVDPACLDINQEYDPTTGPYDASQSLAFCTPWTGVDSSDPDTPVQIDDTIFELTSCDLEASATGATLVTVPQPGFGTRTAVTVPAQFVQEHEVDLVCYLGRLDGAPIDLNSGALTVKGDAAHAAMRFRLATLPSGLLLRP